MSQSSYKHIQKQRMKLSDVRRYRLLQQPPCVFVIGGSTEQIGLVWNECILGSLEVSLPCVLYKLGLYL